MAEISKNVAKAVELLKHGELVGMPTETVYGLAGNALIDDAVLSIFEVKNRPKFDPLILHFSTFEKALPYILEVPAPLKNLIQRFTPGPLTFLLPKSSLVSDLITAGLDRVAIRIPTHPLAQELLAQVDFPVAAPSANPFGYVSPTSAKHVDDQLGNKISLILDGGECQVGLESTIVGMEEDAVCIYRKGGLSVEDIEEVVGEVIVKSKSSSQPAAPGMLHSHYAPNKTNLLFSLESFPDLQFNPKTIGFITFSEILADVPQSNQIILSPSKDLNEAASKLFSALREMDKKDIETLYLELVPEIGLGRAINDRIRRATNEK